MRNKKRWLAAVTAMCMVIPSVTAFADEASVTGTGSLEYDSGMKKDFCNVVLPTVTDATYGFTLDPSGKLNAFDSNNYAAKTVFFKSVKTVAKLSNPESSTSDGKLYVVDYAAKSGEAAALLAEVTGGTVADGKLTALKGANIYCVWVPDTDNMPNGKYVQLTADNIEDYCVFTGSIGSTDTDATGITAVALKAAKSGEFVSDGKLYEKTYKDLSTLSSYDADSYVTVSADGSVTVKAKADDESLYVTEDSGATYVKVDAANKDTYLKYTPAEMENTDTSETVKIVNKSSGATTVTATVTIQNPGSLAFVASDTFAAADTDASVYMALVGKKTGDTGDTTTAVASDGEDEPTYSAEVSFDLPGTADSDYFVYQGGVNPATGGHYYERYLNPSVTYADATFKITAAANNQTGAADAWKAYAEELEAAYKADSTNPKVPKIDVVYDIQSSVSGTTALSNVLWVDGNMWFALKSDGGFTDRSKLTAASIMNAEGEYVEISDLTKIVFNSEGWAYITWANLVAVGQDPTSADVTITIEYDGTTYSATTIGL